jgi:murein L,D-transpeptidase YcbB/YkuD
MLIRRTGYLAAKTFLVIGLTFFPICGLKASIEDVATTLSAPGGLIVAGQILDQDRLRSFYSARGYALVWDTSDSVREARTTAVLDTLRAALTEGLEPTDYHIEQIDALATATTDKERLDRDFLITDGVLRYAGDVSGGKLMPGQTDERTATKPTLNAVDWLNAAISLDPTALTAKLASLPPTDGLYSALKIKLTQLRGIAAAGSWPVLPEGGSIHPNGHDSAVPALRLRLLAEGYLTAQQGIAPVKDAELYGLELASGVARFQADHGIKPDGVIGKDTRLALNMSVEARIDQVVVNLERARWIDIPLSGRMVEVNLPGYSLKVYQDGKPVMAMPVVVGNPDHPTPILATRITNVILNPTWTLPPVVLKELAPKIRADADYLAEKGIERQGDRLVQPAGPSNPLGRYKFVMPNDQDIYLHDTSEPGKFRYVLRAYSHGCVRLGDPASLAALLLDDQIAKLPASLDDLVQTGETRQIGLSKPVPVSLVYRTAWLDADGHLVTGGDIYKRDSRLWVALHKPRPAAASSALNNARPSRVL